MRLDLWMLCAVFPAYDLLLQADPNVGGGTRNSHGGCCQSHFRGSLPHSGADRRVQAVSGNRCHGQGGRLYQGDQVDVGDRVRQGQLLATLEVPEMGDDLRRADASTRARQAEVAHAQDELQRAESAHQMAHLSFERLSAVAAKRPGLIAQQEIDDAKEPRPGDGGADRRREIRPGRRQGAGTRQHRRRSKVKTLMDYTRVTAPFAGVITKRYADMGSMIQAGTASQTQAMPVVRLSQNSRLRLILPVPESAVPTVHIGQQVEVRVPTLNRSFPGGWRDSPISSLLPRAPWIPRSMCPIPGWS